MGKNKQSPIRVLDGSGHLNNQEDQQSPQPKVSSSQKDPRSKAQEAQQCPFEAKTYSPSKTDLESTAGAIRASYGHSVKEVLEEGVEEVDLGLDISTAVTGVVLLNRERGELKFMGHVRLTSVKLVNLFDKADAVIDWIKENLPREVKVSRIFVEANAKGYSMGFSSADTLFTLAKMNALVSYLAHKWYKVPVLDINVTSARTKIGFRNNKSDKRQVKEKVREFVLMNNPHLPFKTRIVQVGKKKGAVVPAAGVEDEIDAFVICRGGQLLHP